MAKKRQFKTESKQLLNLMIHSIYTNKEIFLRELISNASDASDKAYFKAMEEKDGTYSRSEAVIRISADKETRVLTIADHGIGMSESELETNLGTIAKSGSKAFKDAVDDEEIDIIGQFGVGFYSAFMVSDKIEVISRAYGSDEAFAFKSNGVDGYTLESAERAEFGTTINCYLREDSDDADFSGFLESYKIKELVKTYSDYIRYPIVMSNSEGQDEVLNSMVPLWKRSKSEVTAEELNQFYKDKFHDSEDPARVIRLEVEGTTSFQALLFIPSHVPFNFYTQQYEAGLQLYSRNVFIMEHNKSLITDSFRFVQGIVDSPDLNLNISREILQEDRQLQAIASRIEKKIKSELEVMLKNERDSYEKFWANFGLQIKFGLYSSYGMQKELLQDLLMFNSSYQDKLVTLAEYAERMEDGQDVIYFASADTLEKAKSLPQSERVIAKGYEVLYLSDDVDEFVLQILMNYKDKAFKSVNQGDLNLESDEEKQELEEKTTQSKDMLASIKEKLTGKVDDVQLSSRLVSYPVCLTSKEGVSIEMEKVLNQMPDSQNQFKASKVLEINPNHPLYLALNRVVEDHPERMDDYAQLLYDQACLIEGLPIENPIEFSKRLSEVMVEASQN